MITMTNGMGRVCRIYFTSSVRPANISWKTKETNIENLVRKDRHQTILLFLKGNTARGIFLFALLAKGLTI